MTSTEDGSDDLVKHLQKELQLRFYRELFGLDENDQPRNRGFTGIRGIFDEVQEFAVEEPPQGPQFVATEVDQVYDELMFQVFQGTTEEVIRWLLSNPQGRHYARSGKTGEIMDSAEYIALYV